jgi:hypothetical protein
MRTEGVNHHLSSPRKRGPSDHGRIQKGHGTRRVFFWCGIVYWVPACAGMTASVFG